MDPAKLTDTRIDLADGLYLRSVREEDVDEVLALVTRNYEHLRTFMEWAKPDYGEEDAIDWVQRAVRDGEEGKVLNFFIRRDDRIIGTIGFSSFDHDAKVTEIGYWVDEAEEGKGITSRATKVMLDLAFNDLGMNRVQIRCADANERSAAIPRKLGFVEEGRQRQHVKRDGTIYDFLIFGLLREEWIGRNAADPIPKAAS
ncbi:MAG: GNAT family N-acetyltransferase [Acidobacteria bacterium]|nr:GNAT family N-acetyltransferase [Acidobacteriota bacterium]